MAGLVPFNSRKNDLANTGYGGFYNMLDDFFAEGWPFTRSLIGDTFKLDVREDEKAYYVEAELPGVKKEEIGVVIDDGRLHISVERSEQTEDKQKNYIHKERRYSSMQRNVYLADADAQSIKAKLDNGVLSITLSKKARESTSKHIEIE